MTVAITRDASVIGTAKFDLYSYIQNTQPAGSGPVYGRRDTSRTPCGKCLKRRFMDAGLPHLFSPHSFRATVVTDLLKQNGPLKDVQYLAGHSTPRTTQIYDRRRRRVTLNIVERISI